jgi:homoserine dehydrogenase
MAAVLANKAPLVLAFDELHELAGGKRRAGLQRHRLWRAAGDQHWAPRPGRPPTSPGWRGIFNSTSNFILGEMTAGRAYADALAEAQRRGLAETDPSLDVEGWDTANKLVIIANSFLGMRVGLADVAGDGHDRCDDNADLQAALAEGSTIKLVASAL